MRRQVISRCAYLERRSTTGNHISNTEDTSDATHAIFITYACSTSHIPHVLSDIIIPRPIADPSKHPS